MRLFAHPGRAVALMLGLLFCAIVAHLTFGAKQIMPMDIGRAFWHFDPTNFDHVIVRQMRAPRTLTAICVGASLSVSGALMQGVTRNPLADPGLLGLMSGAAFGVVVGSGLFGIEADIWMPAFAAVGALAAALLVGTVAVLAPFGRSPAVLLLSGAAVSAFLTAVVTGINIFDEDSFSVFRVWLTGAITADAARMLPYSIPWLLAGMGVSLISAPQVTALAMGHETAAGLGVNTAALSRRLLFCTVVLTAASVAMVGPLGFVGLVVPHAVRLLIGADYRLIVPCSAILGALFLLAVDLTARVILAPVEVATGVITTLLGAPVFVLLVRRVL